MRRPILLIGVLVLIFILLSSALFHPSTVATTNARESKQKAITVPSRPAASGVSSDVPRTVVPPPAIDSSALAEAQLGTAALESNTAWITALRGARTDGLATIKTGSNLQSVTNDIAPLRRLREHWRISVRSIDVLWARVVGAAKGQVLMHKTDESRALYRHGHAGPLLTTGGSYYSLYTLESTRGRWLVSTITQVSDARGAQLVANPPHRFATIAPRALATSAPLRAPATTQNDVSLSRASPTPTTSVRGSSADPAEAVRAFYSALSARDYATAFSWFTIRLQSELSDEARWANQYKQESSIVVTSATVSARSRLASTVAVTFVGTWAEPGGKPVQLTYTGQWELLYGLRGWRLDSPDNLHRIEV